MNESMMNDSLVASARVARRFALEYCPHTASGNCTWYHGVWQYFRALGVTKTAGGSADFLGATLRSLAAGGDVRRVMISGAADDAMALVAIDAFRDMGKSLDLTVVDRCETPLALARWSAERLGTSVTTHRSDILGFHSATAFDVVMTNSFLGAFDPARRTRLFARWASLLRPGGKLLFTNRLRPGTSHAQFGFTPDQAQVFCAAVRREAERASAELDLDPEIVEGWARVYAERYRSYPVRTVDEVLDLLRNSGFAPDRADTARVAGRDGARAVAGPSVAEQADYIRLLATRT
jgi:SAM-dependent methyltransferase